MKIIKKKIPGGKGDFYLRKESSDEDLYRVLIDQDEYGYIQFFISPKVIVDVGANIGLSSVYFAIHYPDATIYALEPALDNYEMLKKNTAPYSNIVPIFSAIMATEGFGTIYDPGQGDLAYQVHMNVAAPGGSRVSCTTISALCQKYSISKIDLLKIDIEGAELEVFQPPLDWISLVSTLIIELHERINAGCNETVFNAIEDNFQLGWIGGENYYFSKTGVATPVIPPIFKGEHPEALPIEKVWELQVEMEASNVTISQKLVPVFKRIEKLEEIYQCVDALEGLYQRVDALEGLYQRVDAVEGLYQRVDALEGLYQRVDAVEGLYQRMDALEGLYQRVDALEGLYQRMDALEGLYQRVDALEGLYQRVDALECLYSRIDKLENLFTEVDVLQRQMELIHKAVCQLQEDSAVLNKIPSHRLYKKLHKKDCTV